jgi:ribose transport system ATP-binding protein
VTRPLAWIDPAREREAAKRLSQQVTVVSRSIEQPVAELSGGNQQKVLIARWLMRECDVLLFDEPTRGIDVAAKQTVYRLLGDLAAAGKAIVIVSSELRELMALCDRIAVMSAGHIVATYRRGEWTEDRIMHAAISGHQRTTSVQNAPID